MLTRPTKYYAALLYPALVLPMMHEMTPAKDDGTPWPTIEDVTIATTHGNADGDAEQVGGPTDCKTKGADRETKGGPDGTCIGTNTAFDLHFSKAIMHLTRAASRSRCGESFVKVRVMAAVIRMGVCGRAIANHDQVYLNITSRRSLLTMLDIHQRGKPPPG